MRKYLAILFRLIKNIFFLLYLFANDNNNYNFIKLKVGNPQVKRNLLYMLGRGLFSKNNSARSYNKQVEIIRKEWDILFISEKASPDLIKDITALKSINPEIKACILTTNSSQVGVMAAKLFDEIVLYENAYELLYYARRINSKRVILRRGNVYHAYLVALIYEGKIFYRPYPFTARYPEHIWGKDNNYCEKEIIMRSSGIYHFYNHSVEELIRTKYKVKCPMLIIRSECMPEIGANFQRDKLSSIDGKIHMVYAAGIQRAGSLAKHTGQSDQYDKFRAILDQGIHIHWYQAYPKEDDKSYSLKRYFDLTKEYDHFHREEPLEYHELLETLPQYDWAFQHFSFEKVSLRQEFLYGGSNGFYTHLQAGNLLVVSPSTPLYADVVKKNNVGIVVEKLRDFKKLKQEIDSFDSKNLQLRINDAINQNSYPNDKFYNFIF